MEGKLVAVRGKVPSQLQFHNLTIPFQCTSVAVKGDNTTPVWIYCDSVNPISCSSNSKVFTGDLWRSLQSGDLLLALASPMSWSLSSLSLKQSHGEYWRGSSSNNTITLACATQDRIYCKASWYALLGQYSLYNLTISETLRQTTCTLWSSRFWRSAFGEEYYIKYKRQTVIDLQHDLVWYIGTSLSHWDLQDCPPCYRW